MISKEIRWGKVRAIDKPNGNSIPAIFIDENNKRKPGCEKFWNEFYALYLNGLKLTLNEARERAARIIHLENPSLPIPTIHQVRYHVSKLNPSIILTARNSEAVDAEACTEILGKYKNVRRKS